MSDDSNTSPDDNVLIGAEAIEAHLASIGFPDEDAYYLKKIGRWPIGKYGKFLIATRTGLDRHARKLTAA
jgi:hypothetical protein